jgi:ribosomal protein S18 acetylase RimI-like enzyme
MKKNSFGAYDRYVEWLPTALVARFREYDRDANPLTSDTEYLNKLMGDIQQNGIQEPLILEYSRSTRTALLTEGNHRLAAALRLGLTEVPVRVYRREGAFPGGKGVLVPGFEGNYHCPADMKPSDIGVVSNMKIAAATTDVQDITQTPAFKAWFGNSEVVDSKGHPLKVYHGTSGDDFKSFSNNFHPSGMIFFTTDPKFASMYAGSDRWNEKLQQPVPDDTRRINPGSRVIPVYLKCEKLFDYRQPFAKNEAYDFFENNGMSASYYMNEWDFNRACADYYEVLEEELTEDQKSQYGADEFASQISKGSWVALELPSFVNYLINNGYDGVVLKECGVINYAVFNPNQVKSAVGNTQFNPEDWSITASFKSPTQGDDTEYKPETNGYALNPNQQEDMYDLVKVASPDFGYTEYNEEMEPRLSDIDWNVETGTNLTVEGRYDYGDGEERTVAKIVCTPLQKGVAICESGIGKKWRGSGLGQILYDKAIEAAKDEGYMRLWSDDDRSEDANSAWGRLSKRYPVQFDHKSGRFYIDLKPGAVMASYEERVNAALRQYQDGKPGLYQGRPGELVYRDQTGKVAAVLSHDGESITQLAIHKAYRNEGIGRHMAESLCKPVKLPILYHGTKSEFDNFDLSKAGQSDAGLVGKAVYFTPTFEQAEQFSQSQFYGKGDKSRVIAARVNLKNPFVIADGRLPNGEGLSDIHPNGITHETGEALRKRLQKLGYDGVIFTIGGEVTQVAVYDPAVIEIVEPNAEKGMKLAATPSPALLGNPAFKRWFGNSKVVDAQGSPLVVYRGDYRADRIGDKFKVNRSTSGRFYFTDNPEIASSYAQDKPDEAHVDDNNQYYDWFKFPGHKYPRERIVPTLRYVWNRLTPTEKARVKHVVETTSQDSQGNIIFDAGESIYPDLDWMLQQQHGNWLMVAYEIWLASGTLYDNEREFSMILDRMNLPHEYDNPSDPRSVVTPVFLSIQKPLDTYSIPQQVLDQLHLLARKDRSRATGFGVDQWDKTNTTPREWVQKLDEDIKNGTTYAWTTIPEKVTKLLQSMGYDGIKDSGGKRGGMSHTVWIAFEPNQIKSAIGNKGTFDPSNDKITASVKTAARELKPFAGSGWLTWNGVYHRVGAHTPHSRAALRLGLATRGSGDSEDDINAEALRGGNVRVLGNEFEAWEDNADTRDLIAHALEASNYTIVSIEFHQQTEGYGRTYERNISVKDALEWMYSGVRPGFGKTSTDKTAHASDYLPSFEEWLSKNGGLEKVIRNYDWHIEEWFADEFEKEYPEEEPDGYTESHIYNEWEKRKNTWVYEKCLERAKDHLEELYDEVVWQHDRLGDEFDVYRTISIENLKSLKTEGIGIYWAWTPHAAEAHWGDGGQCYTFRAHVKESDVDWSGTLDANLDPNIGEQEKEIRLWSGSHINITGWCDGRAYEGTKWGKPFKGWKNVTAAAKQDITNTPEFKSWFGRSVLKQGGKPTVMWHGSKNKFDKFEYQNSKRYIMFKEFDVTAQGFFFAFDREHAAEFGPNVQPFYVRMEHPVLTEREMDMAYDQCLSDKKRKLLAYIFEPCLAEAQTYMGKEVKVFEVGAFSYDCDEDNYWVYKAANKNGIAWDVLDNPQVVARMKEKGFDGCFVDEDDEHGRSSVMVFSPNQIKSADQNSGKFDPEDARVTATAE